MSRDAARTSTCATTAGRRGRYAGSRSLSRKWNSETPTTAFSTPSTSDSLDFEGQLLAQQRPRHHPVEELVKNEEEERQQQADQGVVHVQAHAHGGGEIPHQRLHDAEHAERILGKRILRQPHQGAHQQSADLAAPHQREVHHHQQRHLQKAQKLEEQRNVDLEQDGGQGHHQHDPGAETAKPGLRAGC